MTFFAEKTGFRPVGSHHGDASRAGEPAEPGGDVHPILLHQVRHAVGRLPDDLLLVLQGGRHVQTDLARRDADLGSVLGLLEEIGRVEERLRRDAAPERADAAQPRLLLDDQDRQAQLRGPDRGDVAAGSRADDDEVVRLGCAHAASRKRAPTLSKRVVRRALWVVSRLDDRHDGSRRTTHNARPNLECPREAPRRPGPDRRHRLRRREGAAGAGHQGRVLRRADGAHRDLRAVRPKRGHARGGADQRRGRSARKTDPASGRGRPGRGVRGGFRRLQAHHARSRRRAHRGAGLVADPRRRSDRAELRRAADQSDLHQRRGHEERRLHLPRVLPRRLPGAGRRRLRPPEPQGADSRDPDGRQERLQRRPRPGVPEELREHGRTGHERAQVLRGRQRFLGAADGDPAGAPRRPLHPRATTPTPG